MPITVGTVNGVALVNLIEYATGARGFWFVEVVVLPLCWMVISEWMWRENKDY